MKNIINSIKPDGINWLSIVVGFILVVLAVSVINTIHVSRDLTGQKNKLQKDLDDLYIHYDQLMLEEGSFSRTGMVTRKAKKNLQMQKLTLGQIVRVVP